MMRKAKHFTPHLERYIYAMGPCEKRKTLDLGGKSGYGADLLSYVKAEVTVVDNNQHELNQVKGHTILNIDLNHEYPEGMWDAAVAFEIIEHVIDPDDFVKNIAEHLNPGGRLIFSVPHMKEHEDHLTLFDEEKIRNLISKHLTLKEMFMQDKYCITNTPFKYYPKTYVGVAEK